eukprot:scaffold39729_cov63-Phaeocystis_antarctica.AAC.10
MAERRAVAVREVRDAERGAAAQQRLQRSGVELRIGGEAERTQMLQRCEGRQRVATKLRAAAEVERSELWAAVRERGEGILVGLIAAEQPKRTQAAQQPRGLTRPQRDRCGRAEAATVLAIDREQLQRAELPRQPHAALAAPLARDAQAEAGSVAPVGEQRTALLYAGRRRRGGRPPGCPAHAEAVAAAEAKAGAAHVVPQPRRHQGAAARARLRQAAEGRRAGASQGRADLAADLDGQRPQPQRSRVAVAHRRPGHGRTCVLLRDADAHSTRHAQGGLTTGPLATARGLFPERDPAEALGRARRTQQDRSGPSRHSVASQYRRAPPSRHHSACHHPSCRHAQTARAQARPHSGEAQIAKKVAPSSSGSCPWCGSSAFWSSPSAVRLARRSGKFRVIRQPSAANEAARDQAAN